MGVIAGQGLEIVLGNQVEHAGAGTVGIPGRSRPHAEPALAIVVVHDDEALTRLFVGRRGVLLPAVVHPGLDVAGDREGGGDEQGDVDPVTAGQDVGVAVAIVVIPAVQVHAQVQGGTRDLEVTDMGTRAAATGLQVPRDGVPPGGTGEPGDVAGRRFHAVAELVVGPFAGRQALIHEQGAGGVDQAAGEGGVGEVDLEGPTRAAAITVAVARVQDVSIQPQALAEAGDGHTVQGEDRVRGGEGAAGAVEGGAVEHVDGAEFGIPRARGQACHHDPGRVGVDREAEVAARISLDDPVRIAHTADAAGGDRRVVPGGHAAGVQRPEGITQDQVTAVVEAGVHDEVGEGGAVTTQVLRVAHGGGSGRPDVGVAGVTTGVGGTRVTRVFGHAVRVVAVHEVIAVVVDAIGAVFIVEAAVVGVFRSAVELIRISITIGVGVLQGLGDVVAAEGEEQGNEKEQTCSHSEIIQSGTLTA